jgi:CPA1 family monovalent cation:H+ antiporter
VWNLLFFTFNGAAFVLIGLQLRAIVAALGMISPAALAVSSLGIAAVVVLARYAWVFGASRLRRLLTPRLTALEGPAPSWQVTFILGTAGMRGVVSLAAAFALPVDFPHRNLILFVTFVVIVVTLVGQGLLMPVLIRRWRIVETDDALSRGVALARVKMAEAVRERLRELESTITATEEWEVIGRLAADYEGRIAHYTAHVNGTMDADLDATQHAIESRLRREAFAAERRALLELRGAGQITDEAYRHVEWQVDLAESRLDERSATSP